MASGRIARLYDPAWCGTRKFGWHRTHRQWPRCGHQWHACVGGPHLVDDRHDDPLRRINNTATAIVAAPVAIGLANQMGVDPDPFLMAVAIAASCAFLTPIGHKNNMLILGPGGYSFSDYWRMGLPLEIIIVAVSVPAILVFWPL